MSSSSEILSPVAPTSSAFFPPLLPPNGLLSRLKNFKRTSSGKIAGDILRHNWAETGSVLRFGVLEASSPLSVPPFEGVERTHCIARVTTCFLAYASDYGPPPRRNKVRAKKKAIRLRIFLPTSWQFAPVADNSPDAA